MKITVFTGNQPRHIALIESLSSIADEIFAIQECNTVFPGQVDDYYKKTRVMQEYFQHVIDAEKIVFGNPRFSQKNVRSMNLKSGDLSRLEIDTLKPSLRSDLYIVFGSSFIKGALCDFLVSHKAINIHMGTSPYYRGSSCNFWAMYDNNPDYVGATIHMLSKGLDSGSMLFHALPKAQSVDPFLYGMLAVKSAHDSLVSYIKSGKIWKIEPIEQDKSLEIRYTINQDFIDDIVSMYLNNLPTSNTLYDALKSRDLSLFLRPYIS